MADNTQMQSTANMLNNFATMMQLYQFAPPSDNIWTVSINSVTQMTENDENQKFSTSLGTLYQAIVKVNQKWNEKVASKWEIKVDGAQTSSGSSIADAFLSKFAALPEIFLAQDLNFSPIQVDMNHGIFPQGSQFGSFYNFGRVAMARPNNRNLNISFLVSNWDIGDILFDPWIAAVAQKGLIEDGQSSIKANIVIKEYTAVKPVYIHNTDDVVRNLKYNPEKGVNEKLSHVYGQMECKKQYKFFNCVPIKRGEISKNYEPNEAGTFKKSIVNFVFDDYKIEYLK